MTPSATSGLESQPTKKPLHAYQHSHPVDENCRNQIIEPEEMIEIKSSMKMKSSYLRIDETVPVTKEYSANHVPHLDEDCSYETSASSRKSFGTGESTVHELRRFEEIKLVNYLTRPVETEDQPSPPRQSNEKKPRPTQRNDLEQLVRRTILETASFAVKNGSSQDKDCKSADFILSDLVEQLEEESLIGCAMVSTERYSQGPSVQQALESLASTSFDEVLDVYMGEDAQISAQFIEEEIREGTTVDEKGLEATAYNTFIPIASEKQEPETTTDKVFKPVESFDSLSWKDDTTFISKLCDKREETIHQEDHAGTTEATAIPIQDPPSEPEIAWEEVVVREKVVVRDEPKVQKEEVVFSTNFDEWKTFEEWPLDTSDLFTSEITDDNGFLITPPQDTTRIIKLKPPSPPPARKTIGTPTSSFKNISPTSSKNGHSFPAVNSQQRKSPASVVDFSVPPKYSAVIQARHDFGSPRR
jgi:hypothetical protein